MLGFSRLNRALVDNAIWFAGSLALAFFVWVLATFQSDPIAQERFPQRLDVRLTPDAGLLVTSPLPANRTASVVIRAPRSVIDLLTGEEIEIWADLAGLSPGEHTVDLQYRLARSRVSIVDVSPNRLRVVLEESSQAQVSLRARVVGEPPAGYAYDEPVFDVNLNQVLVSGPASHVSEIVAAQVELDLRQQRNPMESDMRLVAVDADGSPITDVTLEPAVIHVRVNIRRRDDVREISVRPNLTGQLPAGYVLNSITYQPQVVLVSGSPAQLAVLPETLTTSPIDLTDRVTSFEVSVPVALDDPNLLLLSDQNIAVSVEINPVTASRQFDAIPVEVIGLAADLEAHLAPSQVSVLVSGPQPVLDPLTAADIRVVVDLNLLVIGNYTLTPSVSVGQGQLPAENISVLPAEIDVEIAPAAPPADSAPAS